MPEHNLLESPLFIENAGLVLCWPFIPQLFNMAKIDGLKEPDQASRAVHLLQYLVNNQSNTSEHELPLNKILCGIDLTTPINPEIILTASETELCNQLLFSMTQNWPQMSNSSTESLQASFLQRKGKLTESEAYWLLQVEKKSYDLLLQTLPWQLSPIIFSWMDKKIEIDWT